MNTKQELTDLTICRAIFAAWVFTYHVDLYLNFSKWLGPFADLIRHGYLGVDGFFLLSGLILARVHPELGGKALYEALPKFRPPMLTECMKFWGKRLARVYPVHLATLVILAVLVGGGMLLGWAPRDPARFGAASLLQNLFLVQGWGGSSQGAWNYPSWSVSTEWAGYLLFPFLWYLLVYFGTMVAAQTAIVGFAVIGLVFVNHGHNLNLTFADGLFRFFPEFIAGMATARFVHLCADYAGVRRVVFVAGVIFSVLWAALGVDLLVVVGLWLVMFAFLMQADTGLPTILGSRPVLHWLGQLSYSFYMSFAIAELLLAQCFRRMGWPPANHGLLFAGGMLAITFALAVFLHIAIENPCRRAANRWFAPAAVAQRPVPKNSVKG